MSSFRTDSNETDGGEGTSLRIPNKGNSLSTERTQYLSNSKRMRGASAATRDANAANSMSSAPKPKPAYRSKSSRYTDTLSAREDSPVRTNLTAAAKPSPLQNSTTGLSQQPVEGPLSPKTHPRSSSNTSNWTASQRLGSNSSQTPQRAPASSARKKRETAPSNASANAFAPSALQLRVETVSRNIASSDDTDKFVLESGMRTPRNTNAPALETVIEGSLPNTPATGASRLLTEKVAAVKARAQENILESNDGDTTDGESTTPTASRSTAGSRAPSIMASTAESESEDYRSEDRYPYFAPLVRTTAVGPSRFTSRRMNSSQQHNTESLRNMTVETETVTSMIQLGGGPGGTGSSLRSKKSSDTIRAPKKEKKRRQTAAISTTNGKTFINLSLS